MLKSWIFFGLDYFWGSILCIYHFDPLINDVSAVTDTCFGPPQATSSPNHSGPRTSSTGTDTLSSTASEHLAHPSFKAHNDPIAVQRSLRQRDDTPLINCQSIVDKKPMLENMIETAHADMVLVTESWIKCHHLSTELFPTGLNVEVFHIWKV